MRGPEKKEPLLNETDKMILLDWGVILLLGFGVLLLVSLVLAVAWRIFWTVGGGC